EVLCMKKTVSVLVIAILLCATVAFAIPGNPSGYSTSKKWVKFTGLAAGNWYHRVGSAIVQARGGTAPTPTTEPASAQMCLSTELCNGVDDDCDGSVDEGLIRADSPPVSCSAGVGACARTGTTTTACSNGVMATTACSATAGTPTTEICGNGVDEDCNGQDLACPPSCTETDGGYNPFVFGTVTTSTGVTRDLCFTQRSGTVQNCMWPDCMVVETLCNQNVNVDCLNGCSNGACLPAPAPTPTPTSTPAPAPASSATQLERQYQSCLASKNNCQVKPNVCKRECVRMDNKKGKCVSYKTKCTEGSAVTDQNCLRTCSTTVYDACVKSRNGCTESGMCTRICARRGSTGLCEEYSQQCNTQTNQACIANCKSSAHL
ncbi:MAG TPA: MopE-related protein, partial [Candidatus Nanoarchaeia archaeon]|nr:MopE-related protein [Candidatus Nanoarchaeia archaeon]